MRAAFALTIAALALPGVASAHSFGRIYNLPMPFWMYIYGAAAALVLSFLLVAYFVTAQLSVHPRSRANARDTRWLLVLRQPWLLRALRFISVAGLLLCLLTGFFGNRNPYINFNMTFFWVVFVLGFAYLTALIGDLYAAINPWRVLAQGLERGIKGFTRGRLHYPERLAYWPALAFYMAFIWIELFAHTRPLSLAVILAVYSGINLLGVWLIGSAAWFRYCEFFSVFLRLIARMAPLDYVPKQGLRLRAPFAGLSHEQAEHLSLVVFILFMLSSTAFDGLRVTVPWFRLFWTDPFGLIQAWLGQQPVYLYVQLRPYYLAYETICLLLSPFVYLAVYLGFLWLAKLVTRSPITLHALALRFAFSLLPIVLVYNITHYYTLVFTQGVKIVSLLSDPFGWGWNLFGTAGLLRAPILPDMGLVWHSQVGLILFGHIVSVYLAHLQALQTFPDRRAATRSQLPMLLLMVLFTTIGLWILAQPITSGM
ncbi:MAG: hypothetical protein ACRETN_03435 [Nevskiales bacterium]